ncbi:unnamed protein product [Lampetra fluviatilis]
MAAVKRVFFSKGFGGSLDGPGQPEPVASVELKGVVRRRESCPSNLNTAVTVAATDEGTGVGKDDVRIAGIAAKSRRARSFLFASQPAPWQCSGDA